MFAYKLKLVAGPATGPGTDNVQAAEIGVLQQGPTFPDISIVGIFTVIVYFLLFFNIYSSAAYEGKLGFSLKSRHGFTLSEAFKYGHKKTTTVLCVLFTGLYIGLMLDKGFATSLSTNANDPTNLFIIGLIVLGFCLLLGFLFLFLIPPPGRKNTSQSMKHFLLAIFILAFIILSSALISLLYRSEFKNNEVITAMNALSYTIMALGVFVVVPGVASVFVKTNYAKQFLWRILATSELSIMILFGVILGISVFMPRMIQYEKVCTGFIKEPTIAVKNV